MVGITGFIHDGDQGAASILLDRMGDMLAEGPKLQLSPGYCDDHVSCISASLIFLHLQPYVADDLAVWLDGEIYDFGELAGEIDTLENATAIVAALYRRHGLTFLKTIDGVFTAVIYDRNQMELHLVTDRYGLRRLYIWKGPGPVWASGLRCFLPAPRFTPRIDPEALDDFLELGYITEDRTWFRDVTLLPSGTIFTWDIQAKHAKQRQYWWWNEIKQLSGRLDEDEIVDELGNFFVRGLEKRVRPGERIGAELSGGLNSRAIIAALPASLEFATITFGMERCADRVIAARAAAVRRVPNYQFSLDRRNWLFPRFKGVWLSDGQLDLLHMHGIEATALYRKLFDICFSGMGGDTIPGGSLIPGEDALDSPITTDLVARATGRDPHRVHVQDKYLSLSKFDFFTLHNRLRRFGYSSIMTMSDDIQFRLPFFDNKFVQFAYSIPDAFRFQGRIYEKLLLRKFPKLFRNIPRQQSGQPIGTSETIRKIVNFTHRARRKVSRVSRGFFHEPFHLYPYANYPDWLRREPACTVFAALFDNPKAIYPEYLPRSRVEMAWTEHLRGWDHADELCRYATFEIWLQQTFEKKLRTEADALLEFARGVETNDGQEQL